MKSVDEHYKDWSGEHHTINSCHPVHDSAQACDFAEYYHKEKQRELLINFGKWYSIDECLRDKPEKWSSIVNRFLNEF